MAVVRKSLRLVEARDPGRRKKIDELRNNRKLYAKQSAL